MKTMYYLFKIDGISVYWHISAFFLAGIIFAIKGSILISLIATFFLFISLLLHEYAHCYVAKIYGCSVDKIIFFAMGAVATIKMGMPEPKKELLISLAGPAISGLIGVIMLALSFIPFGLVSQILIFIGILNLALMFFNLLPAFPMDGGRALRAILLSKFSLSKATKISVYVSYAMCILMVACSIMIMHIVLLLVALMIAYSAHIELKQIRSIYG